MNLDIARKAVEDGLAGAWEWLQSPQFYAQLALIVVAWSAAWLAARALRRQLPSVSESSGGTAPTAWRRSLNSLAELLLPLFVVLALGLAERYGAEWVGQRWLLRAAQGVAAIVLLYVVIGRYIKNPIAASFCKWIAIPLAALQVLGWLDDLVAYLDSLALVVGNIRVSAYGVARTVIFGTALFWLGRISNSTGQQIIRQQQALDASTREVVAKLFQVLLTVTILLLLLQIMGINLTALAVFSGAVGVGLGFGLQSIASNFISGIIILLDRSVTVGDYVELEDGRAGTIRELNMRSTTIETFDGKDIVVPNEKLITNSFTNWTHKDAAQRYAFEVSVAYDTDLHALFDLLRKVVASHPQVLSGPDLPIERRPDAEIASFGDSGINILIEFWMNGVDDGRNRVGADLLLMIWDAFKAHGISIPFPQREVRILDAAQPH
jgi:small-conductance mechanosensitive channel